ncbi:LacI family DNA-binding transcriptional regulator [Cupriavidus basilensis]|uniref:LacI family DNA-binding transcriptional regulator n=1 Tax=Cupriavidus basilensis TaxID=68895 RepID=UPI0020A6A562|nr:substrate-binding domain-containing protein [Cupriavidus basilensis]MCP3018222.1 substrate-binding domain-containing protein [Cupriavidus basilensis]
MKRPVQIRDVAKLAGVSASSVSRALNSDRYASDELRARVAEAVAKLGYEPNSVAQSLRNQSSRTIACMVSDVTNPMYAEIIGAAELRFQEAGYLMVVANSRNGTKELELLNMFRRRRMDGLLLTVDDDTRKDVLDAMRDADAPVVLLDRDSALSCDRVTVDHRQGARSAISFLLSLGHRHILLETPSARVRPGRERIAGAQEAVQAAGLPFSVLTVIEHTDPSQTRVFSDVLHELSKPSRPTAIVSLGTEMLAGALAAVEASRLRIPEDISVISIGDTVLAQFAAPGITALRWDLKQFGRTAAELLLDRIEGRSGESRTVMFPTELLLRRSCMPPPGAQRM